MKFMKLGLTSVIWICLFFWCISGVQAQIQISFTGTQPTCNGYTDGTVTAIPSGGAEPYGYFWNNGQGGKTNLGVPAGTYSVTVTDGFGITATGSYTLGQPAPIVASIIPLNFQCGGLSGQLALSANGTAPFSYHWDNGATSSTIAINAAGNYFATLTDAKGCADVADFNLAPSGSTVVTLTTNYGLVAPKCFGGSNGSATVNGAWGYNPPFSYKWQNGVANQALLNVPSGTYGITYTDAQGCTAVESVVIPNNPELIVDIWKQDINCWKNQGTGSLNALTAGGVSPYTYIWSNNSTVSFQQNTVPVGTYTVTVTDANGCSKTDTETIISAPPIEVVFTSISPSCGGNTGSASIQASGGTPPYTYTWGPDNFVGQTHTGLAPGTYYVCTRDAANCTKDTSVVIPNGGSLQVDLIVIKPECIGINDGKVTAVVTPNNSTYLYEWNLFPNLHVPEINGVPGNTTVSVTVTDLVSGCQGTATVFVASHTQINVDVVDTDLGCNGLLTASATATASNGTAPYTYAWYLPPGTTPIGIGPTINGLGLGAYSVIATDSKGCTGLGLADIQQTGDSLTPKFTYTIVNCDSGLIKIQLVDQTTLGAPNSWTWTVTAPAPFGTQVFNTQSPPVLVLPENTPVSVQLSVSNLSGCAGTITKDFTTPTDPDLALNIQDSSIVDCANGPVNLTVTGAPGNVYTWSPMTNLIFNPDPQHVIANPPQTTTYTVSAFNGGCTNTQSIEVKRINNPVILSLTDTTLVTCDSVINVKANINAGIPVVWTDANGVVVGNGPTLNVAVMGEQVFYATATNGDGCTDTDTLKVTGNAVDVNVAFANGVTTACIHDTLTVSATNLDPNDILTYVWSISGGATINPSSTGNSATVTAGVAGTYTVTVTITNQFGCTRVITKPVTFVEGMDLAWNLHFDLCDGLSVGYKNENMVDGVWHFGDGTTSTLNVGTHVYAAPGPYTVTFIPNIPQQCAALGEVEIIVKAEPLTVDATASAVDCAGPSNIQFNGTANHTDVASWGWTFIPGGTSNLQNPVISFPLAGPVTAILTIKDSSGCVATDTVPLTVAFINEEINPILNFCVGDSASLNPVYEANYTYTWSSVPPDPNLDVHNPNPTVAPNVITIYTALVSQGLCSLTYNVTVTPIPVPTVSLPDDKHLCSTAPISVTATSTEATAFAWYNDAALTDQFATGQTVNVVPAEDNVIYVVATTPAQCVAIDSMLVDLSTLDVNPDPESDKIVCAGADTQIGIINNHTDDNLTYNWSPALDPVANPVFNPTQDQTYSATVTNQFGCTAVLSFAIDVKVIDVTASIPGPDTICAGQSTDLLAVPTGDGTNFSFFWTPANTLEGEDTATPKAQPTETTDYTVVVTDEFSCTASDVVTVHFMSSECTFPYIFVPDAFTPNNDDHNDFFIVRGVNISELYFVVWDRWGEKVFETEDVKSSGWDGTYKGKELTPDSYAWYLKVKCGNGATYTKKGDVTLLK